MARQKLDDMTRYRLGVTKSRARRGGKRKLDPSGPFFTLGWVLEAVVLLVAGLWLLNACAARMI